MNMTILATITVAWDCAWWVPRVDQFRPLLCRPRIETKLRAVEDPLSHIQDPSKQYQVLELSWDEKDKLHQKERKVGWKPVLE